MVNEPSEEELEKLAKELGLNKTNPVSEFFKNPLFHGEFGHTINFGFVITMLLVIFIIFIGIFLIIFKKKKRK